MSFLRAQKFFDIFFKPKKERDLSEVEYGEIEEGPRKIKKTSDFILEYKKGRRDFQGIYLEREKISGFFKDIDFRGSRFPNCEFYDCFFENCDFSSTRLYYLQFCNFINCIFEKANFRSGAIRNCKMENSSFLDADLRRTSFFDTNLANSNFSLSILSYTTFNGCNISGVNFTDSLFDSTVFKNGIYSPKTILDIKQIEIKEFKGIKTFEMIGPNVNWHREFINSNIDFMGAELPGVDFRECHFEKGVVFDAVDFTGACFDYANLSQVKISSNVNFLRASYNSHTVWPRGFDPKKHNMLGPGSVLENIDHLNESLGGKDFSNMIIRASNFKNTDLAFAKFQNSIIENTSFSGVDLRGIDFQNAVFRNVSFKDTNLSGAIFNSATFDNVDFGEHSIGDIENFWGVSIVGKGIITNENNK